MERTINIKIKDIDIYRDGGTRELTYEDGTKMYIASPMRGGDVYTSFPVEGATPVRRELAIQVYNDLVAYTAEQVRK